MLRFEIDNLLFKTTKIWKKDGIKAAVDNLINFEEHLNVTEFEQIIFILLKQVGISEFRYEPLNIKNVISRVVTNRNNIRDFLAHNPNIEGQYSDFLDNWKNNLEEAVKDLVFELEKIVVINSKNDENANKDEIPNNENNLDVRVEKIKKYYDKMMTIEIENLEYQDKIDELNLKIQANEQLKEELTNEFKKNEGSLKK